MDNFLCSLGGKQMDLEQIWQTALGELEVSLSKANFTTWFKNTYIINNNEGQISIAVPTNFAKKWLENKFREDIFSTLKKIVPTLKSIDFMVQNKTQSLANNVFSISPAAPVVASKEKSLNSHYIFDNFVVGTSNKLAQAAAAGVVKKPGRLYNPLFIYGGVGLGKTHLLQAIGNQILENSPKKKVLYAPCEKFTNEFIKSLQDGKINDFKKRYRDIDALLIDDIQFIAGKEGSQEEFFHTFNSLHQGNRQIVLTSDRPPKVITALEERLKSRFSWGMIVDIAPPDFEMRKAILQTKAAEKKYVLPDGVINFIAENIQHNIRELEGALNRLIAYLELNGEEPNLEVASRALGGIISPKPQSLSYDKILETIGKYYNLSVNEILSQKRNKEIVVPRQIAMYLLRRELNYSYPQIASLIGKKDHTTIIYAYEKIDRAVKNGEIIQKEIADIKERLY